MNMYDKSIVSSGHQLVSRAAAEILAAGGNAFDGVVAAGFASAVVEPALTSLGGGGLMVGYSQDKGQDFFFDFFVDTPGRGIEGGVDAADFFAVTVNFSGSSQDFNVGAGSVAVPGMLRGLLHTHSRLGRMNFADVIAPAREFALEHVLNKQQAHFLELLYPIMTLTSGGKEIYEPQGNYMRGGSILRNPQMANFLGQLAQEGDESFYHGEIARAIDQEMRENGGLLTAEDLDAFKVKERKPLHVPYRQGVLVTATEPSMGGPLIGLSLALLSGLPAGKVPWGSGEHLVSTLALMTEVERLREKGVTTPEKLDAFLANKDMYNDSCDNIRLFSRGTTHVSVADKFGNCASMTSSNGEGSGYFAPKTGVMLNNMMGEDDLHPNGFHSSPPGERVFSMMSPSLLMQDDRVKLVLGSGGSKRIRIAVSQVLSQVVDFQRPLQLAVDSPRLYLDEGLLQIEPGFSDDALEAVRGVAPVNVWKNKDVYFGGVHAVIPGVEGAGDSRRGGAVTVTHHDCGEQGNEGEDIE